MFTSQKFTIKPLYVSLTILRTLIWVKVNLMHLFNNTLSKANGLNFLGEVMTWN